METRSTGFHVGTPTGADQVGYGNPAYQLTMQSLSFTIVNEIPRRGRHRTGPVPTGKYLENSSS